MKKVHRLYVYGTLKKGHYFHNEYLGEDKSKYLGPVTAGLDYSLYIDGLPHLVIEKTDKPVKGELYEVDDDVLKRIDDLEGHPNVYFREIIEVFDEMGDRILAWTYLRPLHFKGKTQSYKAEEFE